MAPKNASVNRLCTANWMDWFACVLGESDEGLVHGGGCLDAEPGSVRVFKDLTGEPRSKAPEHRRIQPQRLRSGAKSFELPSLQFGRQRLDRHPMLISKSGLRTSSSVSATSHHSWPASRNAVRTGSTNQTSSGPTPTVSPNRYTSEAGPSTTHSAGTTTTHIAAFVVRRGAAPALASAWVNGAAKRRRISRGWPADIAGTWRSANPVRSARVKAACRHTPRAGWDRRRGSPAERCYRRTHRRPGAAAFSAAWLERQPCAHPHRAQRRRATTDARGCPPRRTGDAVPGRNGPTQRRDRRRRESPGERASRRRARHSSAFIAAAAQLSATSGLRARGWQRSASSA